MEPGVYLGILEFEDIIGMEPTLDRGIFRVRVPLGDSPWKVVKVFSSCSWGDSLSEIPLLTETGVVARAFPENKTAHFSVCKTDESI